MPQQGAVLRDVPDLAHEDRVDEHDPVERHHAGHSSNPEADDLACVAQLQGGVVVGEHEARQHEEQRHADEAALGDHLQPPRRGVRQADVVHDDGDCGHRPQTRQRKDLGAVWHTHEMFMDSSLVGGGSALHRPGDTIVDGPTPDEFQSRLASTCRSACGPTAVDDDCGAGDEC